MLDINFIKLREGFLQYLPFGALLGIVLLVELGILFLTESFSQMSLVEYSNNPVIIQKKKILNRLVSFYTPIIFIYFKFQE